MSKEGLSKNEKTIKIILLIDIYKFIRTFFGISFCSSEGQCRDKVNKKNTSLKSLFSRNSCQPSLTKAFWGYIF